VTALPALQPCSLAALEQHESVDFWNVGLETRFLIG